MASYEPTGSQFLFYSPRDRNYVAMPELEVADEGYWGLRCTDGHRAIRRLPDKWHRHRYACEVDHYLPEHDELPLLLPDSVALLSQPNAVIGSLWYHRTERSHLSRAYDGVTHLGTSEAAEDRNLFLISGGAQTNLFTAKISAGARVAPHVLVEPTSGDHGHEIFDKWFETADVIMYVNSHEAPGSISLAIKPSVLTTVVGVT
ncbi:hypothetical protein LQ938_11495 [Microbacterium sp. cx-55]|uniref:hypothetical protein n=1 Tax=Microbacterium sp. cx-55 TaxID=2875948 RepID=UPI001CBD577F|nr:hypothetical protein [Microbacterium sp. cx-55]MBZ4488101.1 hypothetical protein [Microbacterium sp. cx-55]UGB34490.1 hypothetical protein LQ938_11495 [Microbacterium sp. cx-55]